MKKSYIFFCFILFPLFVFTQDINYARHVIDTLTSKGMSGRGYVDKGETVASNFIKNEFSKYKLANFDGNYFQSFNFSINTLPGKLNVKLDEQSLIPGEDFLVTSSSVKTKGTFKIIWFNKKIVSKKNGIKKFVQNDLSDRIIILDNRGIKDKKELELFTALKYQNVFKAKGVVTLVDSNLTWGLSDGRKKSGFVSLDILRNKFPKKTKEITLDIENKYIINYETQNVVGFVKGKTKLDSFLVFTAHYDHLGRMGKETYFPGANDNASGTAMILNLAKHFSVPENQSDFSIVFIAFSGEEVALLGSKYFTEHPLFPLSNIKFLVNLDMVGTGSEGIKVVNATVFTKQYKSLVKINDECKYLKRIAERGECNFSDHYFFYKNNVPSFFIYTFGKEHDFYHDINDKAEILPLTEYEDLFKLLVQFTKTFN